MAERKRICDDRIASGTKKNKVSANAVDGIKYFESIKSNLLGVFQIHSYDTQERVHHFDGEERLLLLENISQDLVSKDALHVL